MWTRRAQPCRCLGPIRHMVLSAIRIAQLWEQGQALQLQLQHGSFLCRVPGQSICRTISETAMCCAASSAKAGQAHLPWLHRSLATCCGLLPSAACFPCFGFTLQGADQRKLRGHDSLCW